MPSDLSAKKEDDGDEAVEMRHKIISEKKDPLGTMMLDYLNGDHNAYVEVTSTTLDMWKMSGRVMFRPFKQMNRIERKALSLCKGRILDIGAGSGCHSLYLQKRNQKVDSIDISPGCVSVMKKRKLTSVFHDSVFSLKNRQYHTLLMLMNGLGICGSIDGLHLFFQFIRTILDPKGQLIADSTDLSSLYDAENIALNNETYYGETQFTMTYKAIESVPFEWLYIDFDTLHYYANFHGLSCKKILSDNTGKYLVKMTFI